MMNFRTFVTLTSVLGVVMTLQGVRATEGKQPTAKTVNCLAQMNELRAKAGFSPFTQATDKKHKILSEPTIELSEACEIMSIEPDQVINFLGSKSGTPAISIQNGEEPDCEAAVKEWKGGLTKFPTLPPPFDKPLNEKKEPYSHSDSISFIALFNPNAKPTVDCMYFDCPAVPIDNKGTLSKAFKGLMCLTNPPALKDGEAPFTQEQWEKIKAAVAEPDSSGTTAAAPTFVLLMAVALGVSLI